MCARVGAVGDHDDLLLIGRSGWGWATGRWRTAPTTHEPQISYVHRAVAVAVACVSTGAVSLAPAAVGVRQASGVPVSDAPDSMRLYGSATCHAMAIASSAFPCRRNVTAHLHHHAADRRDALVSQEPQTRMSPVRRVLSRLPISASVPRVRRSPSVAFVRINTRMRG